MSKISFFHSIETDSVYATARVFVRVKHLIFLVRDTGQD